MSYIIGSMGIMAFPLIISSIIAIAVIASLFMTLTRKKVIPDGIADTAKKLALSGQVTPAHIQQIRDGSLLGRVLASGLESIGQPRHVIKENIEESGRHVVHSMEKYMTTLGTIAAIAPLLGLLGTVIGMIDVFSVITAQGVGSPTELAGGISKALMTTAFGITIAVPALIFHRYFRGRITDYAIEMEKEAIKILTIASAPQRRVTDAIGSNASNKRKLAAAQAQIRKGKVA